MILLNVVKGLGAVALLSVALAVCILLALRDRLTGGAQGLQRFPELPGARFPAEAPAIIGAGGAVPSQS